MSDQSTGGSPKATRAKKPIAPRERHFAKLMADTGMGGVEAARIAFGWRCEPGSKENDKARNLARTPRIKAEVQRLKDQAVSEEKAKESIRIDFGEMKKGDLRDYAAKILMQMRDSSKTKSADRYNAIKQLKKLYDPGKDVNLIYKWIDLAWRYQTAHCPSCHNSFALAEVKNDKLDNWRDRVGASKAVTKFKDRFSRQMEIITRCDPRRIPHKGQIKILSAPERHVVGEGAARAGKATHENTPILTSKGWRTAGELTTGDVVYDENGEETTIVCLSPVWTEGKWYELEFDTGERIIAHENHDWLVHDYKYRSALRRRQGTRTAHTRRLKPQILETKELIKNLYARETSHANYAVPVAKAIKFPHQELNINPWLLGLWLGDGSAANAQITIDHQDNEQLDKIENLGYKVKRGSRYVVNVSNGLAAQLKELNLLNNKHIPDTYLYSSPNQRLALLQGLMDSDGTIDKQGRCTFDNVNKNLADGVLWLIRSLGIKAKQTSRVGKLYGKEHQKCYRVNFTTTLPVFSLKRKLVRLPKQIKQTQQYHYIKNIRPVKSTSARCIQVNSPSHLYLAGRALVPTHNSYLLALIAAMGICLPGVEIWILAETYDRASKEVEYLKNFLNALFFPHYKSVINTVHDKKTGEMIMTTKWGSEVRVKSSKAKGSITGHALELALCAEPGWLPADIYEELRARMSERLGRIIAIGTPKGVAGFIGRLTNMYGRDPRTGKRVRWRKEQRLIENGCPWNVSMLITKIDPGDNPEYVKSELDAARMELTDEEYAQEFEGIGVNAEGAKFGLVRDHHLKMVDPDFFERAVFMLGVDQGPKNFGGCLVAYDGVDIVPCWEYFNSDDTTSMKKNLIRLRARVPRWIRAVGGDPDRWVMTIVDQDPPLDPVFYEMEEEGQPWPTEITKRHKNMVQLQENWRRENQEFVNNMARHNNLWFHLFDVDYPEEDESPGAYVLHDQVRQCQDVASDPDRESRSDNKKGWQVSDPTRGDHVLDAWYLAVWLVCSQQIRMPKTKATRTNEDPWGPEREAFEKRLAEQEKRELGMGRRGRVMPEPRTALEAWQQLINRRRTNGRTFDGGWRGPYGNDA